MRAKSFWAATALLLPLLLTAVPARALDPVDSTLLGVAIDGYDPVAYFTEGKPVEGDSAHTYSWRDATWRFTSAENRDRFATDPERYAPQYGGYCAWAVSKGYTAGGDPQAWTLHEGKLYLNYSKSVRANWAQDIPGNVAAGDRNWPRQLGGGS